MELKTGRLMALSAATIAVAKGAHDGVEPVPHDLSTLARLKMAFAENGATVPVVNMRSAHPLAKWGRDKRKEKRKAKVAAASRRRNRK